MENETNLRKSSIYAGKKLSEYWRVLIKSVHFNVHRTNFQHFILQNKLLSASDKLEK